MAYNTIYEAINGVRKAGNKAALAKVDLVNDQDFTQWCARCRALQAELSEFNAILEDPKTDSRTLKKAGSAGFREWEKVVQTAMGGKKHKLLCRSADVYRLFGLNARFVGTIHGAVIGNRREGDFRRLIETLIGVRIHSHQVISDKDAAIIEEYDGCISAIRSNTDRLEGKLDNTGRRQPGLRAQLATARATKAAMAEVVKELTGDADTVSSILSGYTEAVNELSTAVKEAEKRVADATKRKGELDPEYTRITDAIAAVEAGVVESVMK